MSPWTVLWVAGPTAVQIPDATGCHLSPYSAREVGEPIALCQDRGSAPDPVLQLCPATGVDQTDQCCCLCPAATIKVTTEVVPRGSNQQHGWGSRNLGWTQTRFPFTYVHPFFSQEQELAGEDKTRSMGVGTPSPFPGLACPLNVISSKCQFSGADLWLEAVSCEEQLSALRLFLLEQRRLRGDLMAQLPPGEGTWKGRC